MTIKSYFWTNAAAITESEWRLLWRGLHNQVYNPDSWEGVWLSEGRLRPSLVGNNMSVRVEAGAATVGGNVYVSPAPLVFTPPAVAADTGGAIVLRADDAAQTVRMILKMSPDGTTATPSYDYTEDVENEYPIASFTVTPSGAITDLSDETYYVTQIGAVDRDRIIMNGAMTPFRRHVGGSDTLLTTPGSTVYTYQQVPGIKLYTGTFTIAPGADTFQIPFIYPFFGEPLVFVQPLYTNYNTVLTSVTGNAADVRVGRNLNTTAGGTFAFYAVGAR